MAQCYARFFQDEWVLAVNTWTNPSTNSSSSKRSNPCDFCNPRSFWHEFYEVAHNYRLTSQGHLNHLHDRSNVACRRHGARIWYVEEVWVLLSRYRIYQARLHFYSSVQQTLSDFADVTEFADNIKRNSTRLKEIGTKDLPNWIYTTWLLNGLDSDYDSFRRMLTNNRKADQAEGIQTELDFDSILEQILNLDTQKVSESSVGIPVIPRLMFSWLKFATGEASSIILPPATPSW